MVKFNETSQKVSSPLVDSLSNKNKHFDFETNEATNLAVDTTLV